MNKRLEKPSGIPKPNSKTAASTYSKSTASSVGGRMPLTRENLNLPHRPQRATSPDLGRNKEVRVKLRRSRSFNDLREVPVNVLKRTGPTLAPIPAKRVADKEVRVRLRRSRSFNDLREVPVNALKRTAPTLAPIPAKRVAPPPQVKPKPPPGTGALGTRAKAPPKPAVAAAKVAVKKIPPYDYKARFHALLEKHNAMKEKFEDQREQLVHLEGLPEQFEESQAELQKCQEEVRATRVHNECLERETKASAEKIEEIGTELKKTQHQLQEVTEKCRKVQENEKILTQELEELKESTKFLTEENIAMNEEVEACRDQLFASVMERKDLHNQMMDLRGNIRVFCRVRPPLECELERPLCQWQYLDEASLEVVSIDAKNKSHRQEFTFDQVFHPKAPQEDVFEMVSPLIQSALDGYNVCIFAYGQTGSGKTYTMDGTEESLGVIPRTVDLLFSAVKNYRRIGWEYEIRATFLEIYNEVLYDLLDPTVTDLDIRMVSATNKADVYVSNITEKIVKDGQELRALMDHAKTNRATACTVGNERSSRSHAITRLQLLGVHEGKQEKCVGTINLVDLAGSESPKTSIRMEETKKINRSLSELTNVIMAIIQKNDHVPYRNSKLTYLLMPCLGGNSKTLMFINVAPFQECYTESIKSLKFAASVNTIKMSKIRKNRFLNTSGV